MSAQSTNVEVIANNIANSNTTAFKRSLAEFSDLIYQQERLAGVPNQAGAGNIPEATQIGLGVQLTAIQGIFTQGPLNQTNNTFDLALQGNGFFQVQGLNNQTLYTRAGNFNVNNNGMLVTSDGSLVVPNINIGNVFVKVQVNQTGVVSVDKGDGKGLQPVGQLTIALFPNQSGLQAIGNNYYMETQSSGNPQVNNPGQPGYGTIQQGYLEQSNVDPVQEITNLINAQRNYEMNSKVVQAADEMYQTITKGSL
jgi:flagellar basal-body rod protein FlgG